jgi:uncharacterized protein CbrC (UPF0167 family)
MREPEWVNWSKKKWDQVEAEDAASDLGQELYGIVSDTSERLYKHAEDWRNFADDAEKIAQMIEKAKKLRDELAELGLLSRP